MNKTKTTQALKHRDILKRLLRLVIPMVLLAIIIPMGSRITKTSLGASHSSVYVRAEVTTVLEDHSHGEPATGPQTVEPRILSGEFKGKTCTLINPNAHQIGAYTQEGTGIIALVNAHPDGTIQGRVTNYDRSGMVYLLLGLFALATLCVGGKKGVSTLYALVFTFVCVLCMYIPLLYVGWNGILAAIATAMVILAASIYIINGWSKKTLCSILGTTLGITISGVLAMVVGNAFHITGYQSEELGALLDISQHTGLKISDLLFAGILISSLGAVMDVSVSIVAAMDELQEQSPHLTGRAFFRSGMRVGKDMIGTMSNTLILAYTGSATGVIVCLYAYNYSYTRILDDNTIITEILCGLCGTIGVILTVPIQAFITALLYQKHSKAKKKH